MLHGGRTPELMERVLVISVLREGLDAVMLLPPVATGLPSVECVCEPETVHGPFVLFVLP